MSKSPLAGAFAEGSTPEKKKNKKGAALLIIAGIGLTASVGGVFAANSITINSGDGIQFGQGVAATNACVASLDTTMTQTFDEVTNTDVFLVDDVTVAGDFTACDDQTLVVSLRDVNGAVLASGSSTRVEGTDFLSTDTDDVIDFTSANINAGDVKKITVTTE
jgi:hypothetical protein